MVGLTEERELLLDKLYNLRSDESIIITGIKAEIETLEQSKKVTEEEKRQEEKNKEDFNVELATFTNQADIFLNKFSEFDNSSFESLKDVGVDVPVGTLLAKLRDAMPNHKGEIDSKISSAIRTINEKEAEINRLISELESAQDRLSSAEATKGKINLLLNDILVLNNNSYNRDFVKSVLDDFKVFTEEEMLVLEFLILFPENGLIEYDRTYANKEHKNPFITEIEVKEEQPIAEVTPETVTEEVQNETQIEESSIEPVIAEVEVESEVEVNNVPLEEPISSEEENIIAPSEPTVEETPIEEEVVADVKVENVDPIIPVPVSPISDNIFSPDFNSFVTAPDEPSTAIEEMINNNFQEQTTSQTSQVEENLKSLGVEIEKINSVDKEQVLKLLSTTDEKVISKNLNILKGLNIPSTHIYAIKDGFMYLTDSELSRKIDILKSRKISDEAITNEILNWNFTESYQTFAERIEALETTEEKLTDQNIGKLKSDIINYYSKILNLSEQGIELDDKEIRNNEAVLMNSPYVIADSEILKNHSIKLVRKNGKFALETFWKTPAELTASIETMVEADLSKLIETNPEILAKNTQSLLRRIKYCQENNISVMDDNNQYYKYIYDELEFQKSFGAVKLPTLNNNNEQIPNIIGNSDYVKILVDYLDSYYNNITEFKEINFENNELLAEFNKIISGLPSTLKAQIVDDEVYNVSGTLISKSKAERNIAILVDMLSKQNQVIDGLEREIILTATMYSLYTPVENLNKIAGNCLGFNETSKRIGGLAA